MNKTARARRAQNKNRPAPNVTSISDARKRHRRDASTPGQGRGIHQIGLGHLLDFLSEMLVLQKNSVKLMSFARDRAASPEIHQALQQYVDETEQRADEIRTVIRDLGGNPVFMSPAAEVQRQRAEFAHQISVPARLQPLCDIENCWYSSLQENVHLAFIRSVIPYLDSLYAQDRLADVLDQTAREQEERLELLQQTLHRLLLQRAIMPSNGDDWFRAA